MLMAKPKHREYGNSVIGCKLSLRNFGSWYWVYLITTD